MSELREAFREAARHQFAMVPAEVELDWVFSPRFERKMRRIIRAQEYGYWNLVNTTAKRIAIAAAIIVMLLSTVMAIKPVRERVIKFFVDVYEEYFEIHFGEEESWDLPERTEPMVRYTLTELPEGYVEVEYIESDHLLWTEWRNEKDDKITLQQESGTHEITVNIKNVYVISLEDEEIELAYYRYEDSATFLWEQHEYIFTLSVHDNTSVDQVLMMIESLEKYYK